MYILPAPSVARTSQTTGFDSFENWTALGGGEACAQTASRCVVTCDHSCYSDLPMILPYIARSCRKSTATVDFSPTMIFDSPMND